MFADRVCQLDPYSRDFVSENFVNRLCPLNFIFAV
jgi:hypothetical protein